MQSDRPYTQEEVRRLQEWWTEACWTHYISYNVLSQFSITPQVSACSLNELLYSSKKKKKNYLEEFIIILLSKLICGTQSLIFWKMCFFVQTVKVVQTPMTFCISEKKNTYRLFESNLNQKKERKKYLIVWVLTLVSLRYYNGYY